MNARLRLLVTGLASVCAIGATPALAAPTAYADLLLVNGKVVTVDGKGTIAEAVAVRDGRIAAIGDAAGLAAWRGPETKVVDVGGKTVLPGFIDSHSHMAGMAEVEALHINVHAPPLKSGKEIIATLKEKTKGLPKGAWIIGQGTYNQIMPTREALDKAFPDNPVRLIWSAHDSMINHAAAVAMGLTKDYPDPKDGMGRYERTKTGEVMIIRDAPAPWPKLRTLTPEELKESVRTIMTDFYLKKGVTTVSDYAAPLTVRAYQELKDEGRLPVRVSLNFFVRDYKRLVGNRLPGLLESGARTGLGDEWLQLGALKFAADGVWGTTAYTYRPHWNGSGTTWMPDNYGGTNFTQEELSDQILQGHKAGWQIHVHANGDRAQDMALNAFEAAQAAAPRPDARHRIEHFGHFLTQDPERTEARLDRMVKGGVIPSPQVAFLWRLTDVNVREPDVKFFALKTMIDKGMHPAGGVDTIGTQNFATAPMFSISRAIRRDTKYGTVVQPEEAISVMDAIRMFTIWGAEANFMEKDRGSLEVGKLADMVVLSQDPLTATPDQLPGIEAAMTIIDGKVAYQKP